MHWFRSVQTHCAHTYALCAHIVQTQTRCTHTDSSYIHRVHTQTPRTLTWCAQTRCTHTHSLHTHCVSMQCSHAELIAVTPHTPETNYTHSVRVQTTRTLQHSTHTHGHTDPTRCADAPCADEHTHSHTETAGTTTHAHRDRGHASTRRLRARTGGHRHADTDRRAKAARTPPRRVHAPARTYPAAPARGDRRPHTGPCRAPAAAWHPGAAPCRAQPVALPPFLPAPRPPPPARPRLCPPGPASSPHNTVVSSHWPKARGGTPVPPRYWLRGNRGQRRGRGSVRPLLAPPPSRSLTFPSRGRHRGRARSAFLSLPQHHPASERLK